MRSRKKKDGKFAVLEELHLLSSAGVEFHP
jgi:hypothetical protein